MELKGNLDTAETIPHEKCLFCAECGDIKREWCIFPLNTYHEKQV